MMSNLANVERASDHYANIPQELKARRQWVCYRVETRDGKSTKVPYRAGKSLRRAKTNDPCTWDTFEAVVEAASQPDSRYDGIGLVFSKDDPYVGTDLDSCVNSEGLIESWAADAIGSLDTYCEFSPSGKGVHAIARGEKPGGACRKGHVEMYDRERFFTFTGRRVPGTPAVINERQRQLLALHSRLLARTTVETAGSPLERSAGLLSSDDEIVERAKSAANGAKFARLWSGDWSGYGSRSEADMALCCSLAFWTGKDEARMDALFRRSGLMRGKWDELRGDRTYGQMTTEAAIARTTDVYGDSSKQEVAEEDLRVARERIARAKEAGTSAAVFTAAESVTHSYLHAQLKSSARSHYSRSDYALFPR